MKLITSFLLTEIIMSKAKYLVIARIVEYHSVEVEAETEDEAIRLAEDSGFDNATADDTEVKIDRVEYLDDIEVEA